MYLDEKKYTRLIQQKAGSTITNSTKVIQNVIQAGQPRGFFSSTDTSLFRTADNIRLAILFGASM